MELPGRAAEPARKPNIIIFLSDDVGYGEYGFQGNKEIPIPCWVRARLMRTLRGWPNLFFLLCAAYRSCGAKYLYAATESA
jgi:hypothetical protein